MAAPGYGPGAGSPGVPLPEDSTQDAGRISLEFRGVPESSHDARRSNTPGEGSLNAAPACRRELALSPGLGAGRSGTRGLQPWDTTWGLQAWQRCSRNQPSKTAPARALARPQTGLSVSAGLASPLKPIWRGPQTSPADRTQVPARPQAPGLPQLESPVAWRPYSPIAAPLAPTWRR